MTRRVRLTEAENKRLAELLAKKEAEAKQDAEFFKEVRARRSEVLKELHAIPKEEADESGTPDTCKQMQDDGRELAQVAMLYGCTSAELLQYIASDRQVQYFRRNHQQ